MWKLWPIRYTTTSKNEKKNGQTGQREKKQQQKKQHKTRYIHLLSKSVLNVRCTTKLSCCTSGKFLPCVATKKLPLCFRAFLHVSISRVCSFVFTFTLSNGRVFFLFLMLVSLLVKGRKQNMLQCLLLKTTGSFILHKHSKTWVYLQVNIRDKLEVFHDV